MNLFIISEGVAYHMINDSVQTVRKGDLIFIRPNDMHSYNILSFGEFLRPESGLFYPGAPECFPVSGAGGKDG